MGQAMQLVPQRKMVEGTCPGAGTEGGLQWQYHGKGPHGGWGYCTELGSRGQGGEEAEDGGQHHSPDPAHVLGDHSQR